MSDLPPDAIHPLTLAEWHDWLAANSATSKGVWLATYKKATGRPRIEYEHAVEEALCWGWIDSVARGLDDQRSLLRFSPRKKGSGWARTNKVRLERLIAENRVSPAALEAIEAAQRDGSWTKLDEVENRTVPDDLRDELGKYPDAGKYFDAFPPGEKRRILEWIVQAKTPETRAKRIVETAAQAQINVRANLWKKGKEKGR